MSKRPEKVCFGTCSKGCDLHWQVPFYLLFQRNRFKHFDFFVAVSTMRASWHKVFEWFLDSDAEYLHCFDADVGLSAETTERLIDSGKELVISPVWHYVAIQNDIHLNVHLEKVGPYYRRTCIARESGCEKIEAGSFASLLIKRSVLEAFVEAGESYFAPDEAMRGDGLIQDNVFFEKAKKLGFQPYVQWGIPIGEHMRTVRLNSETLGRFIERIKNGAGSPTAIKGIYSS